MTRPSSAALLLIAIVAMAPGGTASAATIAANSGGYGLSVDLSALGLNVDVGPLPSGGSWSAPAPYSQSQTVLNVNVASSIPIVVSGTVGASVVTGAGNSTVDGFAGLRTTMGSGGIVGANIDLLTLPILGPGITLLGLDGTLSSAAQITGDHSALVASGMTVIQSLGLTIGSIPVDLSAYVGVSVAPNTGVDLSVLGIANASLILNEQIISPDNSSIVVNALHLDLNILSIGGEVILGHSFANVTTIADAVPEPASLALAAIGLAMAGVCRSKLVARRI